MGVNRLLAGADPILTAYADRRISPRAAQKRFDRLERRFASYAVAIAAVSSAPRSLRALQRSYAHTYVLEDTYLSALDAALPERSFDALPRTQNAQREAIVAWRVGVEAAARRFGIRLPADLRAAGRGEIAPSPAGS